MSKLQFPLATIRKITAMFAPRTNCGISATARSETARLRNKLFKVADMDDAFHSARITRRFPRVAPTENVKFKLLQ